MTVNEKIKTALSPLGLPVKPDRYKGDEESYIAFGYTVMGALYANDKPTYERYLIQVHYFCPAGVNTIDTRKNIKRLLFDAGFTWPGEIPAGDDSTQHYVFECEITEGVEDG